MAQIVAEQQACLVVSATAISSTVSCRPCRIELERIVTWKAPARARGSREGKLGSFEEQDRGIDTMIEVFDPRRGGLLASRRVPHFVLRNVGRDTVYNLRRPTTATCAWTSGVFSSCKDEIATILPM